MKMNTMIATAVLVFGGTHLQAATLNVPSANYSTIQACADAAQAGDTCLVSAGIYPEHVSINNGGTSEQSRIIFKADGKVTMRGFDVNHEYVTIDGFDITGYPQTYSAHINVNSPNIYRHTPGGNYCHILNNTIRDGAPDVAGIAFRLSQGTTPPSRCMVRGNILTNLNYTFISVAGSYHLFENNILEVLNNRDYLYVFGHDHIFRGNVFRNGNRIEGIGNHPDWVQTFGDNGHESYNMLFEQNWIQDVQAQLAQLNSGGGERGIIPTIHSWIFRNNVFINISNNMNVGLSNVVMDHNTFYRMASEQNGVGIGGSLTRGETSGTVVKNNVFLAGGETPNNANDIRGFYSLQGFLFTTEVLRLLVIGEVGTPEERQILATDIARDLVTNGYLVNTNGALTEKAKALTDISQFVLSVTYTAYKTKIYELLVKSAEFDKMVRATSQADHNYVAGAAPDYFPKRADRCTAGVFTPFLFCEVNGINGGNPDLQLDFSNPDPFLGPDLKPFTADDGLKPRAGSRLCGKGTEGRDIGVYSCNTNEIFADGSPPPSFPALPPGGGWSPTTGKDNLPPAGASFESFKNVFNPKVDPPLWIGFRILNTSPVALKIFDRRGNKVVTLFDGTVNPALEADGIFDATWNGRNEKGDVVSSGTYILQLLARGETITKKVVVVK